MIKMVPLGELVKIITGKLDANAASKDGTYPFFTCARDPLKIDKWQYDLDAILVAGNGDLNVKHYIGKFDAYQRTYIITVKNNQTLLSRYLYYFMDSYLEKLREHSIGGIIKYIKLGMLNEAQIPLPPLEEQKRIVAILDQADALRRLRQRSIDRLNSLGQVIFYEMFGDSISNYWRDETTLLTAVCEKITDGTHQAPEWSDNGIPFIFVSNVRNQRIDLETKKFVSQAVFEKLTKNTKIEAGDVLYTCVGSYGHTAVVDGLNKFVFQRHIAHLKPDKKIINPHFLAWCLESSLLKQQADCLATGIAQKTVTLSSLKIFRIPIPVLENQLLFANRIDKIENQKIKMLNQLQQAETLFLSLQHKAFNGELSGNIEAEHQALREAVSA